MKDGANNEGLFAREIFDQKEWPHCTVYAFCKAFNLAISDAKLKINEKSLREIILSDLFI